MRCYRVLARLYGLPLLLLAACESSNTPSPLGCSTDDDCPEAYFCDGGTCAAGFGGGGNGGGGGGGAGGGTTVDNDPPSIIFLQPLEGHLVGTPLNIRVRIRDASAIASVTADISGDYPVALIAGGSDEYSATFDLSVLPEGMFAPNLSVTAVDQWGHTASRRIGFWIDTTPPLVALDGPGGTDMRVWLYKESEATPGIFVCSAPLNPLGSSATGHGALLLNAGDAVLPRVRVEDRGNKADGGFIAGIDPGSVKLYVLDSEGLQDHTLLSTSGLDGDPCDVIDPDGVVEPFILDPIPIRGAPDYKTAPNAGGGTLPSKCSNDGTPADVDAEVPDPVCLGDSVTMWIGYGLAGGDERVYAGPAIFGLAFNQDSPLTCGGDFVDMANFADGTACLAVAAADANGNVAISAPIAVCVDLDPDPLTPDCSAWPGAAAAELLRCSERACTTESFPVNTLREELAAGSMSCAGVCGGTAPGGCRCDLACFDEGGCCDDVRDCDFP